MPINIDEYVTGPLEARMREARKRVGQAADGMYEACMLAAAWLVRSEFPSATQLVVVANVEDSHVALRAVRDSEATVWSEDGSTADSESWGEVLAWVSADLAEALGGSEPREWGWAEEGPPDTYAMRLPDPEAVAAAVTAAPGHSGVRAEIVVDRDPDAGTDVALFIDGVPHDAEVTVVDPGQGHTRAAWLEQIGRASATASPAAARQIRSVADQYDDSPFIEPVSAAHTGERRTNG